MGEVRRVCARDDLAPGTARCFAVDGQRIALVRIDDDFYAIGDTCSHASTVGPIDDDQLYYLESRGIPPDDAERLIVLGFFDDVFERLPIGALSSGLRRSVVEKLEHRRVGGEEHRRHG